MESRGGERRAKGMGGWERRGMGGGEGEGWEVEKERDGR